MSENQDNPRFCEGCPLVPKGVVAELLDAGVVTMADLRRYQFAHDVPEFAESLVGQIRLHTKAVSSQKSGVDPDDEAHLLVKVKTDVAGVVQAVRDCDGPRRTFLDGRVCRALGRQTWS